jgi:hypothetical protein
MIVAELQSPKMFTLAHNRGNPLNLQSGSRGLANVLKMIKSEHLPRRATFHYADVKTKELTPKQVLSVPCNTCGAAIGEACELNTGALRTEPHRDRKLFAAEAAETKTRKR